MRLDMIAAQKMVMSSDSNRSGYKNRAADKLLRIWKSEKPPRSLSCPLRNGGGFDGRLWIWKDGLGGFRGTGHMSGRGESLCQLLTESEIEANGDWEPMMPSDVDPEDRPVRHRHNTG